jgi:hypothetical protein
MDLTAELKARLIAYNSRNAPGAFGSHRYTLEEYGLTGGSVRQAFKEYMDRFSL